MEFSYKISNNSWSLIQDYSAIQ